jgi:hypothetical protein
MKIKTINEGKERLTALLTRAEKEGKDIKEQDELIDEIQEKINKLELVENGADKEIERLFDEFLDDSNPLCQIGELSYLPSEVLKAVDLIAYDVELTNFSSSYIDEQLEELDDMLDELETNFDNE